MDETVLDEYARLAQETARAAGAILRERFGQPHEIHYKGDIDLVTEADRAAEDLIAARLRQACPDHELLCEEGSLGASLPSQFRWVVDPLDGTTNFAHGMPTFAVSIALEESGSPLLGIVYDPMRDEMFAARLGHGATLNGLPMHVSGTQALIASMLATGFSYDLAKRVHQAEIWRDFLTQVQAIRQTGSSALNLSYIAAGRLDGYWERGIQPWDIAAGALMVSEAGGRITDFRGGLYRSDDREVLASNGLIHDRLLETVARHQAGETPMPSVELGA